LSPLFLKFTSIEQRLRPFENSVLRSILRRKKEEVREGWEKLPGEKPHNFYSSPYIYWVIESSRMIWEGHVAL
jgi:hypothetical protein